MAKRKKASAAALPFLAQYQENDEITLVAKAVGISAYKSDSGWGVYSFETNKHRIFEVAGTFMPKIQIHFYYELKGTVVVRNGCYQLKMASGKIVLPTKKDEILDILRTLSNSIHHSNLIYEKFGSKALQTICRNPEKISKAVPSIPEKMVYEWRTKLMATKQIDESLSVLQDMGIKTSTAKKLIEEFGEDVGQMILANPYFMMTKANYMSFAECDVAALRNQKTEVDSPFRIAAAAVQVLKTAMNQKGHCCIPEKTFMDALDHLTGLYIGAIAAQQILNGQAASQWTQYGVLCSVDMNELKNTYQAWKQSEKRSSFKYYVYRVPEKKLTVGITQALQQRLIVLDEINQEAVYLLDYVYQAECAVGAAIRNIQNAKMPFVKHDAQDVIEKYCRKNNIVLEEMQLKAVETFTQSQGGFFVLRGAAGCGKTFTLKVILGVLSALYKKNGQQLKTAILAPTGKAAKVATEATGHQAYTIHKALGLVGDSDSPKSIKELGANCVVIDEFSMVDLFLANRLLSRIAPTTKVIIMGDTNQLPSIGPGAVLRDIVASGKVETITLNVVKRQNSLSGILVNANKIVEGKMIQTEVSNQEKTEGAFLYSVSSPRDCCLAIVRKYLDLVQNQKIPFQDIQILCPQKSTEVGIDTINYLIQKNLFPHADFSQAVPSKKISLKDADGDVMQEILYFIRGDRVINTANNYDATWFHANKAGQLVVDQFKKGIINGEMGIVIKTAVTKTLNKKTKREESSYRVLVRYDDGYVLYKDSEISALQHAYAMTVHRSQGSQWKITISPMMMCNYAMLSRSIFYTLYTRAQSTNIIYGQEKAIERAIDYNPAIARKTSLQYRI